MRCFTFTLAAVAKKPIDVDAISRITTLFDRVTLSRAGIDLTVAFEDYEAESFSEAYEKTAGVLKSLLGNDEPIPIVGQVRSVKIPPTTEAASHFAQRLADAAREDIGAGERVEIYGPSLYSNNPSIVLENQTVHMPKATQTDPSDQKPPESTFDHAK